MMELPSAKLIWVNQRKFEKKTYGKTLIILPNVLPSIEIGHSDVKGVQKMVEFLNG